MQNLTREEKYNLVSEIYTIATSEIFEDFTDEEKKKLGHSLEDIMFSCMFNNQVF